MIYRASLHDRHPMIVELEYNQSAEDAIGQIEEKNHTKAWVTIKEM